MNRIPRSRRSHLDTFALLFLAVLLVLPCYALIRLSGWIDWRVLVGVPLLSSAVVFFSYRSDKLRAQAGEWRISEAFLQFAAFTGGWPAAFLAQRIFRHKTAKISFQIVFWLIVLLHEVVAAEFLLNWQMTRAALAGIRSL